MIFRTVMKMSKNNAFVAQAMLSSYLEINTQDYLQLLLPFVGVCLPTKVKTTISIENLQKELQNRFGLEIPCNVIERLLTRLCKKKRGSYVKRNQNVYTLEAIYDTKDFDDKSFKIKTSINSVLRKMKSFMKKKKFLSDITDDKMKEFLITFLETYNYTIYDDVEDLAKITLIDSSESNYYVAQFILAEYHEDSLEFQYLLEIIKGSLAAKSIYYFINSENDILNRKMLKTEFILDTRILIDVLNLNFEQGHKAALEMLKLITQNGGIVVTFDYYVEELQRIMYYFINHPEKRLLLSLNKFTKNITSGLDISVFAGTLKTRLEHLGIKIIENKQLENTNETMYWRDNLKAEMQNSINYRNKDGVDFSEALLNDASTIEHILAKRGINKKCSIFDCKTIFVTKNVELCKFVHNLLWEDRFKNGEVSFIITDIDLSSILWLSTFNKGSDLPELKLIENAYSACMPTKEIMNDFLKRVRSLEQDEKISAEAAILLRAKFATLDDLAKISKNSLHNMTNKIVLEITDTMLDRMREEAKEDVYNDPEVKKVLEQVAQVEQERKDLIDLAKKIMQAKHEVDDLHNDAIKINQNNDILLQEILQIHNTTIKDAKRNDYDRKAIKREKQLNLAKQEELQRLAEKTNRLELKNKKRQKKLYEIATQKADEKKAIVRKRLNVVAIILAALIVILFAVGTFLIADFTNASLAKVTFFVACISILGVIITFKDLVKGVQFYINRISEKAGDKAYSNYIKWYNQLLDDEDDGDDIEE